MRILIIGGGNMGQTYARSFLRSHIATEEKMMILEKSVEKAADLRQMNIGTVWHDPAECLPQADLVILAVKPQDVPALFENIRLHCSSQQVFLSIMAGVKIDTIRKGLGVSKIIRAMPNLPAQIGMGMTVFTSSDEVTRIELVLVQNLINTTGKSIYTEQESALDAATAISGSGPAYVLYFMEALMQAAREMGFNEAEAELLVSQTFRGTIELFNKSEHNCSTWIQRVASKGGTTEAALQAFAKHQTDESIKKAARAALRRAEELGGGS